jgi:ADP-heptose:LPS heptosyltransferase
LTESLIKNIILFHYALLNVILNLTRWLLFGNKKNINAKKILIFRTGSLGDSVCALPAIYSIRKNYPEAQIDILTNSGAENLVSLGAIINRTIVNEIINYFGMPKKDLFKKLKEKKYDLFIQLPQYGAAWLRQLRDIFIAKSLGVKYAFGWQMGSTQFLAKYQAKFIKFENERDRLIGILERNGLKSYGLVYPLGFTDDIRSNVEGKIKDKGIKDKVINVGMVVGAKRPQNRWPIEYFKEVAEYLLNKEYNILLFGGSEDFELAEQINGERVFNFCGKLSPLETAEMMKYCKLVISNDTGPMHLAYAVGTPLIAIFSSRDYAGKWFPPEDKKNIVFRNNDIYCASCFRNEKNNNYCLKQFTPYIILAKIKLI